jgi:uncharacterized protein
MSGYRLALFRTRERGRGFFLVTLFIAVFCMCAEAPQAATDKSGCSGTDLLAQLEMTEPKAFSEVMAEARKTANDGALLWRISRKGIADSYLFGTLHMTDERVTRLSKTVLDAISHARIVALEVADVAPGALAATIAKSPKLMMFSDGRQLDQLISPEAFAHVRGQLESARLPGQFARLLKPWVVSMVMAVSDCERKRMANGNPVLDKWIAEAAEENEVPVVGLETMEAQLEAAAAVPMEEQVAMLRTTLTMADRADDLRETLLQLYLTRQIGAAFPLQKLLARRSGLRDTSFEGFKAHMIDRRNRQMRTRALPLLAEGNVFIAVGALHLIGENGLVSLIRNAGFEVTAVE